MDKTEEQILLGQVISRMINSELLLIADENGQELYKGYAVNFDLEELASKQVKEVGVMTKVFKRGDFRERIPRKEKVPVEDLTGYQFSDLEFVIYMKITLEY